ncbi:MAG TPA: hypothetical protein ENJ95_09320 [Bacteroidetes bacterium]|nr:hypothetical protein [Bacteroidota bacterium]
MNLLINKILLFAAILIFAYSTGVAQDVYYTTGANLKINAEMNGKPLHLQTNELGAMLNYETAYIVIRFPIKSLKTGVDSLDNILQRSNSEAVFDGKLGLEYVNTQDHPPMKFSTEGWLTVGNSKTLVQGKGELHHVGNTTKYACMLGMTMQLGFDELNIELPISGLENEFEVVITQELLQSDKN